MHYEKNLGAQKCKCPKVSILFFSKLLLRILSFFAKYNRMWYSIFSAHVHIRKVIIWSTNVLITSWKQPWCTKVLSAPKFQSCFSQNSKYALKTYVLQALEYDFKIPMNDRKIGEHKLVIECQIIHLYHSLFVWRFWSRNQVI